MAEVAWSEQALATLDDIVSYIEAVDPMAARRVRDRLVASAESLRSFPDRGRPAARGFRELVTVAPYVIHYRVDTGVVTSARIRHGRRRPLA